MPAMPPSQTLQPGHAQHHAGRTPLPNPQHAITIAALTILPFLAKAIVLVIGSQGYALQSGYKLVQAAVPAWWRYRREGLRGIRAIWPTDEPAPGWRTWALGVCIAIALSGSAIAAAIVILPQLDIDPVQIRAGMDARFPTGPAGAIAIVIFLSVVNSALEELHFRAWLDRELSAALGSPAGIAISAGAFGAMHVLIFLGMPGLPWLAIVLVPLALAVAGASWSLLMRRRGGIHAAWLSHGLTDALLLGWGLHWLGYV